MTNIATALKEEIVRLARKQLREEIVPLRKTVTAQRSEIAMLKRRAADLEKLLRGIAKAAPRKKTSSLADEAPLPDVNLRFRHAGFAALRKRLELSAADCALLLGTSPQTIYNWEDKTSRPRAKQLPSIAALRAMGKKEARERVVKLKAEA